jgi:hypothetical protein
MSRKQKVSSVQRTRVSGRESACAESVKSSKGYGAMAEKGSKACSAVMFACIAEVRLRWKYAKSVLVLYL